MTFKETIKIYDWNLSDKIDRLKKYLNREGLLVEQLPDIWIKLYAKVRRNG